jgi:hypothetical protein
MEKHNDSNDLPPQERSSERKNQMTTEKKIKPKTTAWLWGRHERIQSKIADLQAEDVAILEILQSKLNDKK